jgi:predicted GIY-YIG superfamily endonuclease
MASIDLSIRREKQLKKWRRDWKIQLIEKDNLEWRDLSDLIVWYFWLPFSRVPSG